jgi:hypothetical protein
VTEADVLLDSASYGKVLDEVRHRAGIHLYPNYPPALRELDKRNVAAAEIPAAALRDALQTDRAELVRFSLEKLRKFNGVEIEQDYPAGQEPSADDRDVTISRQGFARGFLLLNVLEYVVLRDRPDALDAFLKARRIPKAKQYAADLRALFNAARQAEPR